MPPREPRTRGGAPKPTEAAVAAPPLAPEDLPPNKRDVSAFTLPSAVTRLAEPVELGSPNPMRLHVKGNLSGIVYSAKNERALRSGAVRLVGHSSAAFRIAGAGAEAPAAAAAESARVAVTAARKPAKKRVREI